MGVQTSPALPEDEGVPVAGGTYSLCYQRGGSWGGNSNAHLYISTEMHHDTVHSQYQSNKSSTLVFTCAALCKALSLCGLDTLCNCRCFRSWICMPECMRSWWPSLWWRGGRLRKRSLQEETTPPPSRHSSPPVAEPFRCHSVLEYFTVIHSVLWWRRQGLMSIFLCSSPGCYISPSWSELLQDVWDHVWGSKEAGRETAGVPEFLGHHNQDHRCPHHGPWWQHGTRTTTQGGLSAGRHKHIDMELQVMDFISFSFIDPFYLIGFFAWSKMVKPASIFKFLFPSTDCHHPMWNHSFSARTGEGGSVDPVL